MKLKLHVVGVPDGDHDVHQDLHDAASVGIDLAEDGFEENEPSLIGG